MKKVRGRPRAYDPELALAAALEVFRVSGFAGTSLDDLSAATGMKRPSLYAAFGDKKALYRQALARFNRDFIGRLGKALSAGSGLEADLVGFFMAALPTYQSGWNGALSCPVLCTAPSEAGADVDIQADLSAALVQIDAALVARFERARADGELPESADPDRLGRLAAAILHSLALRLRAAQPGFEAESFIRESVAELLKT